MHTNFSYPSKARGINEPWPTQTSAGWTTMQLAALTHWPVHLVCLSCINTRDLAVANRSRSVLPVKYAHCAECILCQTRPTYVGY